MWTCYFSAVVVKYQNHEQLGGGRLNADLVLWGIGPIMAEKAGQESGKTWLQKSEAD